MKQYNIPKHKIIIKYYTGNTQNFNKGETSLNCKEMLNSLYGMCATNIITDEYTYNNDEWGVVSTTNEEKIEDSNDSYSRFLLFYPWGIFVTAYTQRVLFSGIFECGEDYIYSDTDSIYINNNHKHDNYFKKYNMTVFFMVIMQRIKNQQKQ